jgi:hypothetical protein
MKNSDQHFPVVRDPAAFDQRSGNVLERTIFNNRLVILAIFALVSIFLGWKSTQLAVNANFERMIPSSHPYIKNFLDNKGELRGLGNELRVVVENTQGDIFERDYLAVLSKINDELYLLPGVDRPWLKSLWTPLLRWSEVTEEGLRGGPVMPDHFDGSPAKMDELKTNIARPGAASRYVSDDRRSSMIRVPLLDRYPDSEADRLPGLVARARGKGARQGQRQDPRPHRRLRQAGGRPDRGPGHRHLLFRDLGGDRRPVRLSLHPLSAQHAGAGRHRRAGRMWLMACSNCWASS